MTLREQITENAKNIAVLYERTSLQTKLITAIFIAFVTGIIAYILERLFG